MQAAASLKICSLMCYSCGKYVMFEPKTYKGVRVTTLKNDAKFVEELTCGLKNHKRNLANFDPARRSLKYAF